MRNLEQQRALLPKELQDKFVYCPVTDEERAVRLVANWLDMSWKYLKRPLGKDIKADLEEIKRREQKCWEAYMSLSPRIREYNTLTGERLLEEMKRTT
ncbi:MAG: hypothetical protein N4J56_002861 [Chroococcidiopsis sp. SAG 2025]|uniref:hypothetical protein n=1 Tax=Chroococcidiopsis sp. SAG 2025 TaxID=171389 RepID=UPI0029371B0A|nr:hypothetical protein [Chroococcidiopsis sp. SAG 2025]MDV2993207.1 hypothetical protein [Chroococcidiopsis sp. SAG 2025]